MRQYGQITRSNTKSSCLSGNVNESPDKYFEYCDPIVSLFEPESVFNFRTVGSTVSSKWSTPIFKKIVYFFVPLV